jgi:hypothetical protein
VQRYEDIGPLQEFLSPGLVQRMATQLDDVSAWRDTRGMNIRVGLTTGCVRVSAASGRPSSQTGTPGGVLVSVNPVRGDGLSVMASWPLWRALI